MKKKVVVGLSGGVDSSVAAYVLKQEGYDVIGMFMRNWKDQTGVKAEDCPWLDDRYDAESVARRLDIPFHFVDLSDEYMSRVASYMFNEYERGRTPNPDVLCNSEIKFDAFYKAAFELGADFVATGHYCRKDSIGKDGQTIYRLFAGEDKSKDQSYFLCQLNQTQLKKAMFPLGRISKPEVRRIAAELNMVTANKKDSMGICFVGHVDLPVFLQQKIKSKKGRFVEISADDPLYQKRPEIEFSAIDYANANGKEIGEHIGAFYYTVGQRKGLGISGKAKPVYVLQTDIDKNLIYVGQGGDHPGLFRRGLKIMADEVHWLRPDLKMTAGEKRRYQVRFRHLQQLQDAELEMKEDGMYISFDKPQRGIASGQFAVWYHENELLGSGVIS